LLRALALQAEGKPSAALKPLERSLSLAEPEGYVRLYVEVARPLSALLSEFRAKVLVRRGDRSLHAPHRLLLYADRLLAGFPDSGSTAALSSIDRQEAGIWDLAEPLTRRELEVLQLVCEGLSNREIGERLTVTLNTVKKHTSNVYGKLAVQSRAQAIVRARELGLY
jgi:LuxR family maltose regulon positive regulatory protein